MVAIQLTVNGKMVDADVPANTLLVDFLRKDLGLTGTHVGCDTAQCGACVVHMNGTSIKSCNMLAVQVNGATVITIEGLSTGKTLHPVQEAFRDCHALQCGFCTPGMVMSAADLLAKNPNPSESQVRTWLKGNICRCTGYQNIVRAIDQAAARLTNTTRPPETEG